MYKASIRYRNGASFEVESRGHRLISDQPVDNGGADEGMTPPELLLASIGACAGYYALQYLKARNIPTNGLNVDVTADKAAQPARLASFVIDVEAPAAEDERHREGLTRAVSKCLIHNTLLHAPTLDVRVHAPQLAA
jgi:uncharacterized OsmC-like protein